jgi:hypothetical protein
MQRNVATHAQKKEMKKFLLQNSFITLLFFVNHPKSVDSNIRHSQLSKNMDIELQEVSDKCIPVW